MSRFNVMFAYVKQKGSPFLQYKLRDSSALRLSDHARVTSACGHLMRTCRDLQKRTDGTAVHSFTASSMIQDDSTSTFSYDGDGDPDTFSLDELRAVVNSHFGAVCSLKKLGEGGYHKVRLGIPFFHPYP